MYFKTIDHSISETGVNPEGGAGSAGITGLNGHAGLNSLFTMSGDINTNNCTYILCLAIYNAFKVLLMHPDISDAFRNELVMTILPRILINRLMGNIFNSAGVLDALQMASGSAKLINNESMMETENAKIFTTYVPVFERAADSKGGSSNAHHSVIQDPYKNVLFDLGNSLKTVRAIKNHAMSGENVSHYENKNNNADAAGGNGGAGGSDGQGKQKSSSHHSSHHNTGNKSSQSVGVLAKGLVAVGDCKTIFGGGLDENDSSDSNSKGKGQGVMDALNKFYLRVSCVIKPFKHVVEDWYVDNTPGSYHLADLGVYQASAEGSGNSSSGKSHAHSARNDYLINSDYTATSVVHAMISVILQNRIFGSHILYNSNNNGPGSTLGNADNPAFLSRNTTSLYSTTSCVCVCNANIPLLQILQKTVQSVTDFNPFVIKFRPLLKCNVHDGPTSIHHHNLYSQHTHHSFRDQSDLGHGPGTGRSGTLVSTLNNSTGFTFNTTTGGAGHNSAPTFLFVGHNFNIYRVVEYILKHVLDVYLYVAQTGRTGVVYIDQNSFNLQFKNYRDEIKYQKLLMEIFEDLVKTSYSNKLMYIMNEEQKNRFRTFLLISPLMKVFLNSSGSSSSGSGRGSDNNVNNNNKNAINNDTNIAWLLEYSGILSHISFIIHIYDTKDKITITPHDMDEAHMHKQDVLMNGHEMSLVSTWIDYNPAFWKSSYIMSFDDQMSVNEFYEYLETKKYLMSDDYSEVAILLKDDNDKMSNADVMVNGPEGGSNGDGKKSDDKGKKKDKNGNGKGGSGNGANSASGASNGGHSRSTNSRANKTKKTTVATAVVEKVFNGIPYKIESYRTAVEKFDPRSFINVNDMINRVNEDLQSAYLVSPESVRHDSEISFLVSASDRLHEEGAIDDILDKIGVSTKSFMFKKYVILSNIHINVGKLNGIVYLMCQNFSVITISHVIQQIVTLPLMGTTAQKTEGHLYLDNRPSMYTPYTCFFKVFLRRVLLTIIELERSKLIYDKMDQVLKEMESSKSKYDSLLIQINNNNNVLQRTLIGICHDTMQLKETRNQISNTMKEKNKIELKINEIQVKHKADYTVLESMIKWMNDNREVIKKNFEEIIEKGMLHENDMIAVVFAKVIIYAATGKMFDFSLSLFENSAHTGKATTLRSASSRKTSILHSSKRHDFSSHLSSIGSGDPMEHIAREVKQIFSVFSSVLRKTDLMITKISNFMTLSGDDMATRIETAETLYNDFIYTIKKYSGDYATTDKSIHPLVSILSPLLIINEHEVKDNSKFMEYLNSGIIKLHPEFVSSVSHSVFNVRDNIEIVYLCTFILHKIYLEKEAIASNSNLSKLSKQHKTLEETIANFISMTQESIKRIDEESQTYHEIEDRVRIMKEKVHKKKRNMGLDEIEEDDIATGGDIINDIINGDGVPGEGMDMDINNMEDDMDGNDRPVDAMSANLVFFQKLQDLSGEYKADYQAMIAASSSMLQDSLIALVISLEMPYIMYNLQKNAKDTNDESITTPYFQELDGILETCGLHPSKTFRKLLRDGIVHTESVETIIKNVTFDFKSLNVECFRALVGSGFYDEVVDVFVLVHGFIDYSIINAVSIRLISTLCINKSPVYIIDDEDAEHITPDQFENIKSIKEMEPGEAITLPIISLVRSIEFLTCRRSKKYTIELNEFDYNIFPPEPNPLILHPELCGGEHGDAQIEIFTECAQRLMATQKAFLKAMATLQGVVGLDEEDEEEEDEEQRDVEPVNATGSLPTSTPAPAPATQPQPQPQSTNTAQQGAQAQTQPPQPNPSSSTAPANTTPAPTVPTPATNTTTPTAAPATATTAQQPAQRPPQPSSQPAANKPAAPAGDKKAEEGTKNVAKKVSNALSIDGMVNLVIPGSKSDIYYYYPLTVILGQPVSFELLRPFAAAGGEYILEHGNKTEIIAEANSSTKYTVDYDVTYNYTRKATNYNEATVKTFMPCTTSFICTESVYQEMIKNSLFKESTVPIRISSHHNRLTLDEQHLYTRARIRREVLAHVTDVITNCDKTITSNKDFKALIGDL